VHETFVVQPLSFLSVFLCLAWFCCRFVWLIMHFHMNWLPVAACSCHMCFVAVAVVVILRVGGMRAGDRARDDDDDDSNEAMSYGPQLIGETLRRRVDFVSRGEKLSVHLLDSLSVCRLLSAASRASVTFAVKFAAIRQTLWHAARACCK